MPRKEALITQTAAHFLLDLACFFLLAGNFTDQTPSTVLLGAGYLIFFLLSFGLRPFFAMILDENPRLHPQALGCLLVAIALFLPPTLGWVSLFLAGIGSAAFHEGALGEGVCFARGYFSRISILISTGVLGGAVGTLVAEQTSLKSWIVAIALLLCAVLCFFFAEARKYPRKLRAFRNSVSRTLPDGLTLVLTLIPLLVISLIAALLPAPWTEGPLQLLPALACFLGRSVGGIAADRFGPRKTSLACFGVALLLLTVFPHVPALYCVGMGFLWAPSALCFGASTASLPERPHLAVGTCCAVILLGSLPGFLPLSLTPTLRFLCGGLLVVALAVSVGLYTDYCRLFNLREKFKLRKGERT
ncbi:MAG: hypothetical protein IIV79_01515 [Clostridia bacterium]|nr:hypothetical protein [Clostridia bacterium]